MISRGDVWLVNLDPTIGQEIKKTRPAVVVSSNSIGKLPLKIIVPITEWKPPYADYPWMVYLQPDRLNGLSKKTGADTFQVRSVDQIRLVKKLGLVSEPVMEEIAAGIAICIEYK
ncbi:MAG TPA: type II toxin-antitoxin system PemK/MazF family toxin [Acidiferrobacteraceae bacterium]|nr:type II toxin-antitoxin system PemK/MazF family toxin [Acidiferrobacteraceae bacterium]HEX20493.1 type II toxin-antitoxin system PemK/MazF family toxin [Acidiferrobacteraceae bacterium]